MSAEVEEWYQAVCYDCSWAGTGTVDYHEAKREGDGHDERCDHGDA